MDGVFPVFENKFKVGIQGEASTESDMAIVKEMETFSVKMDGKVEEWTPMDAEGWIKRLMTGKGFSITTIILPAWLGYPAGLAAANFNGFSQAAASWSLAALSM